MCLTASPWPVCNQLSPCTPVQQFLTHMTHRTLVYLITSSAPPPNHLPQHLGGCHGNIRSSSLPSVSIHRPLGDLLLCGCVHPPVSNLVSPMRSGCVCTVCSQRRSYATVLPTIRTASLAANVAPSQCFIELTFDNEPLIKYWLFS